MRTEQYDVLVVGSGIAGLTYALECSAFAKVLVVTKGKIDSSNTIYAQTGIAAAIGKGDSLRSHIDDTLAAGEGLCDKQAVEMMVTNARANLEFLSKLNTSFDLGPDGSFDLFKEAGHSHARIVHHSGDTCAVIEAALIQTVREQKSITILEHHCVIDLQVADNTCNGAMILDIKNEEILEVTSAVTMLATGGAGQVYLHNTDPVSATGDGFALAFRAGAKLMNMEMVQFHPTALHADYKEAFLLTQAIIGLGADLKLSNNSTFMQRYHPLSSMAPQHIVARAITSELEDTGDTSVFIDLRAFDHDMLHRHCHAVAVDLSGDLIPVVPAAHYMCGGVMTDLHGHTSVSGLYCCGECAGSGVHGANALAGNTLLEALVYAVQAGKDTKDKIRSIIKKGAVPADTYKINSDARRVEVMARRKYLQNLMWSNAGVIRHYIPLKICLEELEVMRQEVDRVMSQDGISKEWIELLNMIDTARIIAYSAMVRAESRGCHYRSDHPDTDIAPVNTMVTQYDLHIQIQTC